MSNANPPSQGAQANPPAQTPANPPSRGQIRIRKNRQWVSITPKSTKQKGMFTYAEFTDNDGLDTWWIVPPQR
jgi:hypothetical protein